MNKIRTLILFIETKQEGERDRKKMRRIKNQKIHRNETRKRERESQNKRMRRIKNQKIHRNEARKRERVKIKE